MPELTRRRNLEAPDECWHVFYGDVRVGVVAIRTGMPPGEDPWAGLAGSIPAEIKAGVLLKEMAERKERRNGATA
jgi:hypothetical protein